MTSGDSKKLKSMEVADDKDHRNVFSVDRSVALSVAALTSFIVFLWLMAILAVILLKIAIDKCRRQKGSPIMNGEV